MKNFHITKLKYVRCIWIQIFKELEMKNTFTSFEILTILTPINV